MKYVLILGINYRDCKAKLGEIDKEADTRYVLVTKTKHVAGIEADGLIETKNARKNPEYKDIKRSAWIKKVVKPTPPKKVVEEVVEELVPEPIPEEFKEELDALIEKDEDVKEEEFVHDPKDMEELPEPTVEDLVEDQLEDEEDIQEEIADAIEEQLDEEKEVQEEIEEIIKLEEEPVPEVEEVPEPGVDEPAEEIETPVPTEAPLEDLEKVEEPVKPVNTPRGWHARNEFIDDIGNIFHKGTHVGHINDKVDEE